jgi:hypothetical protein
LTVYELCERRVRAKVEIDTVGPKLGWLLRKLIVGCGLKGAKVDLAPGEADTVAHEKEGM